MKKCNWLILAAAVLALSACSKGQTDNVQTSAAATTQAAAAQSTETTAAEAASEAAAPAAGEAAVDYSSLATAELPEEFDAEYYEGVVKAIEGDFVTLAGEDGSRIFDISKAERAENDNFMQGCYAEVAYANVDGADAMPASDLNVLMDVEQQAEVENRDPVIYGRMQLMDINDLEIVDYNGVTRTFDNSMGRKVSFADIKPGDMVAVTYCGSIFAEPEASSEDDGEIDHPISIKIVAMDALGSEEAEANYISGIVDSRAEGYIALLTDSVTFEVTGDEKLFEGIEEENHVRVYYEGGLNGISVTPVKIEKE